MSCSAVRVMRLLISNTSSYLAVSYDSCCAAFNARHKRPDMWLEPSKGYQKIYIVTDGVEHVIHELLCSGKFRRWTFPVCVTDLIANCRSSFQDLFIEGMKQSFG